MNQRSQAVLTITHDPAYAERARAGAGWIELAGHAVDALAAAGWIDLADHETTAVTRPGLDVERPSVLVDVFVPGRPAPQGSKRYLGQRGGKGITVESSKAVAPWRADVREALLDDDGQPCRRAEAGTPIAVLLEFVMPRPASTSKRRTPPAVKRPDLDKLIRAVLDAVGSAGVWHDDSQVVDVHATKRIAQPDGSSGCRITIQEAR